MKRILINKSLTDELRIALVDGARLFDLDSETNEIKILKGSIFKVASERIPSTPSDPTNNLVKSSPTTPLDVLTPVLWISPVPDMNSNPKILSLGVPYLIALGPAELFAILPPIVE